MKFLILALVLSGCAFKDSEQLPSQPPDIQTITIRWKGSDQDFVMKRSIRRMGYGVRGKTPN